MLLGHGVGSLPERCFTEEQPYYMKGHSKKLCQDGYAVWCPYILQAGNQSSQNKIAAMLLSQGVSLHNVSCSSLDAGEVIAGHVSGLSGLNVGCYGVSWGAFLALHLEATTNARSPIIASGYIRDV
jgi:dienelactone hydrolase